jgi:hypothetical protein
MCNQDEQSIMESEILKVKSGGGSPTKEKII